MANFFKTGFVLGTTTAAALPDVPFGFQAWLKARSTNAGVIFIGTSALTAVGSTVTDATSGLELEAGERILLQGPGNLSSYYLIKGSTDAGGLTYMVEG
jgi:hypothetical protein